MYCAFCVTFDSFLVLVKCISFFFFNYKTIHLLQTVKILIKISENELERQKLNAMP